MGLGVHRMPAATTFSVIANGCALADFGLRRLLIDPWCVGDLYRGAWSCYPTPRSASTASGRRRRAAYKTWEIEREIGK